MSMRTRKNGGPIGNRPGQRAVNFRSRDPGYFHDLHNESRRQYVITVSGQVDVEVGDETQPPFGHGDVISATDLNGQGHSTRTVGDEPWVYCAIPAD